MSLIYKHFDIQDVLIIRSYLILHLLFYDLFSIILLYRRLFISFLIVTDLLDLQVLRQKVIL